mmetsp:Transcript_16625/g.39793  ORF Transcript_16625/g.39793 Transcript_16625/m.39793 type:complete len:503 (+) Transcript_16625:179-1687(+)
MFSFLATGIKKYYDIGDTLGKGSFAVVKVGIPKDGSGNVAIKIIDKKDAQFDKESLEMEIQIMKKVDHPNCIKLHEVFDEKTKMYLVLDLVTGGELFDRIIARGHYSEKDAAHLLHDVVNAIGYLHSVGIVHRDLKPENLLYASNDESSPSYDVIKVADFGLAKVVNGMSDHSMSTTCGTPGYVAPEVLEQAGGYGPEVDIWSTGVILYILLCGAPPFDQDLPVLTLFETIINQRYGFPEPMWTGVSPDAKDAIRRMMVADPKQRATPSQMLAHPFVRRYHKSDLPTLHNPAMQQRLQHWKNASRRLKGAFSTFAALLRMSSQARTAVPTPQQQQQILAKVRADERWTAVLQEAFVMLDRDNSGGINIKNIADSLKALNVVKSQEEIEGMLQRFNFRRTGRIDFDEFCIMMGPAYYSRKTASEEEELRNTFMALDFQRKGTINPSQLKEVMSRLGQSTTDQEVSDMVRQADRNRDGVIDYNDFKSLLMRTNSPPPPDRGAVG